MRADTPPVSVRLDEESGELVLLDQTVLPAPCRSCGLPTRYRCVTPSAS